MAEHNVNNSSETSNKPTSNATQDNITSGAGANLYHDNIPTQETTPATSTFTNYVKQLAQSEKSQSLLAKIIKAVDVSTDFIIREHSNRYKRNDVLQIARSPIIFGIWVSILTFAFCGLWAGLAPLDSAVQAPGKVVVDSNRKIIQHLEGGIISKIYVKDGDKVEVGSPLVLLSDSRAKARLDADLVQQWALNAAENRLVAERDDKDSITFSQTLTDHADDPKVKDIMAQQIDIFNQRKKAIEEKIGSFNQKIEQANKEIESYKAQEEASKSQLAIIDDSVKSYAPLVEKGVYPKAKWLELKAHAAELKGRTGQFAGMIARTEQGIKEYDIDIVNIKTTMLNEVARELQEVQVKLLTTQEQVKSDSDVMDRLLITAPQNGTVHDLKYHTIGGVVSPNGTIMEIVPDDEKLLVEAQVRPQDISLVHLGLRSRIALVAYKSRNTPSVEGTVVYVSPDLLQDRQQINAMPYFGVKIEVDKAQFAKDPRLKDVKLVPGMPTAVYIVTGTRTLLRYLLDPITDTIRNAFREK